MAHHDLRALYLVTPTALREWIEDRRLSHREAADLLAMSRSALRKNLYGFSEIGAQTERIVELLDRLTSARLSAMPDTRPCTTRAP
jgi:hypothetical protein